MDMFSILMQILDSDTKFKIVKIDGNYDFLATEDLLDYDIDPEIYGGVNILDLYRDINKRIKELEGE